MFRESFKYYKSKSVLPDFKDVLDFDNIAEQTTDIIPFTRPSISSDNEAETPIAFGLQAVTHWKIYEIASRPGLIFIRNPFTSQGIRYWTVRSLRDYPKQPNVTNLTTIQQYSNDLIKDWWHTLNNSTDSKFTKKFVSALRWTTLGYHHDWDTKVYNEKMKNEFPSDLFQLSRYIIQAIGYKCYSAEAAIVNYYPIGSTLAGHTDHSEKDLEAPLVSISFGQTAIFLIGGKTIDEKPHAIYLKSGDIVIMSKESRLSYHAVPRVFKTVEKNWMIEGNLNKGNGSPSPMDQQRTKRQKTENVDDLNVDMDLWNACDTTDFWTPFSEYLNNNRININVRQVLPANATILVD